MNVLYKYCNQVGIVKILETLELKLPYISEVNDQLECLPFFYCPDDKSAIEARYLSAIKQRNMRPSADYKQKLNEQFEKGEIQSRLVESQRKLQKDWNQRKGCLLCVSKTATEPVMWAHYTKTHRGAVVGIDFDSIFCRNKGILINSVEYSKKRPKINILEEPEGNVSLEAYQKAVMTKSYSWRYEKEYRTIFLVDDLEGLQQKGLACLKDFNGKKTWLLRLHPLSIRKVILGLGMDENLKAAIKKLIGRPDLKHTKLFQTEESEAYTLNLVEIRNR